MKKLLIAFGIAVAALVPFAASAQLTVPQGGTGTTTFPAGRLLMGSSALRITAVPTTTVSCSGTVSCNPFVTIGSTPFTITGASSGSSPIATSSSETSGRVPFWTSTGATPATLSGGVAGFAFNSTDNRLTVTYASTTGFSSPYASTTNLTAGNATIGASTGLAITTSGVFSTIAGTTCTNQFLRAFTVSGGTCATVANTDLANSSVTVNGISIALGASGTVTAASSTLLANNNTFTGLNLFSAASTTNLSASQSFYLPRVATCPASATSGFASLCVDSTAQQLQFANGGSFALSATSSKSFNIASSTLDAMGKSFSVGTTSLLLWNPPEAVTLVGWYCTASTTGTALVRFGDNTNWTNTGSCTTGSYTVASSNNTFTQFEPFVVQASSTAGTVQRITITPVYQLTVQ